jgi:lipoate-protein ligase A
LVSKALNNLGIPSNVNDRFDIVIDGKKVSGSAYKLSGKSAYHHGTMLISTDLDILKNNLTSKKSDLIEGGGVDSVRSTVTRLREYHPSINHDMFVEAVIDEFSQNYGKGEIIKVDEEYLLSSCPQVFNRALELKSREWLFGQTPKFTLTLPEVTLTVKEGIIDSINLDADPKYRFLVGIAFERLIWGNRGVRSKQEELIVAAVAEKL